MCISVLHWYRRITGVRYNGVILAYFHINISLSLVSIYPHEHWTSRRDPFRGGNNILVMCECYCPDGTPHVSNHRWECNKLMEQCKDQKPWWVVKFSKLVKHIISEVRFPAVIIQIRNRMIRILSQWRLKKRSSYFTRPWLCCNAQFLVHSVDPCLNWGRDGGKQWGDGFKMLTNFCFSTLLTVF